MKTFSLQGPPVEYQHPGEVSYLIDVMTAARITYHNIARYAAGVPVVNADVLAAWETIHRSSLAVCQGQYSGQLFNSPCVHEGDVATIDAFIRLLQAGVADHALTRYLTAEDFDAVSAARVRIAECVHVLARK